MGDSDRRATGPVVERALQILAAFSRERPRLTLTEISRAATLPLATTHRLVAILTKWGALERERDGSYHIGLRLWELAALAPRGARLRERALPFMEDLWQVTRENVELAVREDLECVFIERLLGRTAVTLYTRVGDRWPLHPTGVGKVLLAHAPKDVQRRILTEPLQAFTPMTVTDKARLERTLSEIRSQGYAVNDREVSMETLSVAAPVLQGATVVAAVSVVVRAGDRRPDELVAVVRATAVAISRALAAATDLALPGWMPRPDAPEAPTSAPPRHAR